MSEYAWFKLLVRAVGLILLGMGVPMVIWHVGRMAMSWTQANPMATSGSLSRELMTALPGLAAYGAQAALGWYLVFRGEWIIGRVLAEVNGRCMKCGYDTRGLKSEACPECNTPISRANRNGESKPPEMT